uniref:C2 domain-containing protein n=1 Tax=Panagrellus redivivus TaxID=6233 RepID=A0A7E4WAL6_PANRE
MPVRPPVASWNRGELEDQFYRQYDQLLAVKKRNNELEKKGRLSSNRIRTALESGNNAETEARCEQLERENKLLAQKLKALRHQLIAYTRPRANNTTLIGLTSRSSARLPSRGGDSVKDERIPPPVEHLEHEKRRIDRIHISEAIPESSKTITEDKSTIIRLHRENADLADEISELQHQDELREKKFNQLRDEYDKTVTKLHETQKLLKALESNTETAQDTNVVTFLEREIAILEDENKVLKTANDRLVKNSLSDTDSSKESARELQNLQKHVHDLEMRNDELQREQASLKKQLKASESERKSTLVKYRSLKEKALAKQARLTEALAKRHLEVQSGESDRGDIVMSPISMDSPVPPVSTKNPKPSKHKHHHQIQPNESVLDRLFTDVTTIIDSYVARSESSVSIDSRNEPESATKWRQLYEAIYSELEKLRNLLMLQHRINDRQKQEIAVMNDINANNKQQYEKKLAEFVLELNRRAKRIQILENQLHSIAIGEISEVDRALLPDKFIPQTLSDLTNISTTEMSLRLTKLTLTGEAKFETVFLSLEFFDFELETTPLLAGPEAVFEYVAVYEVVVSNLFVHYLETEGLTIELFEVNGVNYHRRAVGVISLKKLLETETPARISGKQRLTDPDSKAVIGVLEYNLDVPVNLVKALKAQKRRLTASSYLPVSDKDIPKNVYNELEIAILRASGLDKLTPSKTPSTYVAYQIYDLQPHMTTTQAANPNPEYNDVRGFNLPMGAALHRYLKSDEVQLFIVEEDRANPTKQKAIGSVTLPMFALARNQVIKGSFPLMDSDGQMTSATLDVSLSWREAYTFNDENLEVSAPVSVDYPKQKTGCNNFNVSQKNEAADSDNSEAAALPDVSGSQKTEHPAVSESQKTVPPEELLAKKSEPPKRTPTLSSVSSGDDGTVIEMPQSTPTPSTPVNQPSAPPESPENEDSKASKSSNSSTDTFMVDDKDLSEELRLKVRETSADEDLIEPEKGESPEPAPPSEDHKKRLERILRKTTSRRSEDSSEASSDYMKSPDSDIVLPNEAELKAELEKLEKLRDEDITPTASPPPIPPPRKSQNRGVEFKEPLHSSIPPSEESSQAESLDGTPRPPPRQKSKPDFSATAGSSAIKDVPIKLPTFPTSPEALGSKITIRLGRLTLTDQSPLLDPHFNDVNVFIEWTLLDFADETCETPESVPLPRNTWTVATFECEQVYELNSRRVALLKQWIENNSRLNFDLVTDPDNNGQSCDDLAVAQLDLRDVISSSIHNITFYDEEGEGIATLDLTVLYSDELTRLLVDDNT